MAVTPGMTTACEPYFNRWHPTIGYGEDAEVGDPGTINNVLTSSEKRTLSFIGTIVMNNSEMIDLLVSVFT